MYFEKKIESNILFTSIKKIVEVCVNTLEFKITYFLALMTVFPFM